MIYAWPRRLFLICRYANATPPPLTPNTPENWQMPKPLSKLFVMTLLLASVGCVSTPPAPRVKPPEPAAWAMLPAPDLMTTLNGIISVSEMESTPSQSK
ncbi:lysis protein [Flyfo siphovirus Tbat2_3]|nr:lysis protein [Flyfo siphovirus Tbat2_3]